MTMMMMMRNVPMLLLAFLLWSALLSLSVVSGSAFVVPTRSTKTKQHAPFLLPPNHNNNNHLHPVVHPCRHIRSQTWSFRLYMAWGPEPIWKSATVLDNVPACPSGKSTSLVLQVDDETASQYTIPGQYVQVRLNDDTKPLFLAMASAPPDAEGASQQFEFLIKKTTGNDWITGLTKGATLEMSQVLGNGFNVQDNLDGFKYDFPTQSILLFATGSGIAPIKAAMESPGFLDGSGRTCRLYYGEQTKDDLCFTDLYSSWEERGYQVVPVLSQEPSNGRCGYVQNALEEDGVAIPRNSGALLCGQKNMAESVSEILKTAGVFEGRILTNF